MPVKKTEEFPCGNAAGPIDGALSNAALRRRWTKSALPGGNCTLLYRTPYNKDDCRALYIKTVGR